MRDLEVDLVDALNVPSDYPHSEYVQSWRPQVTPIDLGEVPENLRGNYNALDERLEQVGEREVCEWRRDNKGDARSFTGRLRDEFCC